MSAHFQHPNLDDYLARIGYSGAVEPTLEVFQAVHRHHALSIPYENLDVMLEVPVSLEIAPTFDKIVNRGRGGWCYEMNGLLGWALGEIGFAVTRMTGGVFREFIGDDAFGNHMVLRVDMDDPWIADVGIGDCFLEPLPLRAGRYQRDRVGATYEVVDLGSGEWRIRNRPGAGPPSFDFIDGPANEARFEAVSEHLQTDPESMFRTRLMCQQMTSTGGAAIVDRTMTDMATGEASPIADAGELAAAVCSIIGIDAPIPSRLWELVAE